jgi:hypothetical protein
MLYRDPETGDCFDDATGEQISDREYEDEMRYLASGADMDDGGMDIEPFAWGD